MIITRLRGGLGNQLFQYACGRALSLRNKDILKLDIEGYARALAGGTDTPREYSLSHFSIQENIASVEEIYALKYPFGIISKGFRFMNIKIFRKFNVGFDARLIENLSKKKSVYLDGFWQTEKYFEDCIDIIRRDITLKSPMGAPAAEIGACITKNRSQNIKNISLHVRRGDVRIGGIGNAYFGICTPDYYKKAFDYIANEAKSMKISATQFHVFIFSDEPKWVEENIQIPYSFTTVSGRGIPDYEELVLMSVCDINIIANSTFSWWGAWLNTNKDKLVISPSEWITRTKKQHIDTIHPSWIRL